MTDIKFRAFDDGKMIYSHNNTINNSNFQNSWFFKTIRTDAIIMQFTGLKDKTGRDIYEGDVVANFYSEKGVETQKVYKSDTVRHGLYDIGCNGGEYSFEVYGFYVEDEFLYGNFINGDVKVIGNIYEK
jgi:uncharacterized phage protein (TIGR01671 family)